MRDKLDECKSQLKEYQNKNNQLQQYQQQFQILQKEKDDIIVQLNQLQLKNNNNVASIQSIKNESKERESELLKQIQQLNQQHKQQLDIYVKKYEKLKKENADLHLQLLNNSSSAIYSMNEPQLQLNNSNNSNDNEKRKY